MRILIAEDDRTSRRILETRLLNWGYEVVVTSNGVDALQALQAENAPQIAILDWMMPGMDGIDVCGKIRNLSKDHYTYIILLSALDQDEALVSGMEAGADDYLSKPFKFNELKVRLRAGRRIILLQNKLIAAREALREEAIRDPLTGLYNHGEILRILQQELDRAEREGNAVGVILADLDYFKNVNDTYGHMTGDAVLLMASRRMLASLRSYDSIGRYGGEEFVIVLPGSDIRCATASAERLRICIAENAMDTQGGTISVTASLGVAATSVEMRRDATSLFQAADLALYQAKEKGRNRVEVAEKTMYAYRIKI